MFRAVLLAVAAITVLASNAGAEMKWKRSIPEAFELARTTDRPVIVFVETDWCHYCKLMHQNTWSDRAIESQAKRDFVALRLNADLHRDVVDSLGIEGFPATVAVTPEGRTMALKQGYMAPAETERWLSQVKNAHGRTRTQVSSKVVSR